MSNIKRAWRRFKATGVDLALAKAEATGVTIAHDSVNKLVAYNRALELERVRLEARIIQLQEGDDE